MFVGRPSNRRGLPGCQEPQTSSPSEWSPCLSSTTTPLVTFLGTVPVPGCQGVSWTPLVSEDFPTRSGGVGWYWLLLCPCPHVLGLAVDSEEGDSASGLAVRCFRKAGWAHKAPKYTTEESTEETRLIHTQDLNTQLSQLIQGSARHEHMYTHMCRHSLTCIFKCLPNTAMLRKNAAQPMFSLSRV